MTRLATVIAVLAIVSVAHCGSFFDLFKRKPTTVELAEMPTNYETLKCMNHTLNYFYHMQFIREDVQQRNISQLFNDVLAVIPIIETAVKECGPGKQTLMGTYRQYFNESSRHMWQPCFETVDASYDVVKSVYNTIKSNGISSIFSVASEATLLAKNLVNKCAPLTNGAMLMGIINNNRNRPGCEAAHSLGVNISVTVRDCQMSHDRQCILNLLPQYAVITTRILDTCNTA